MSIYDFIVIGAGPGIQNIFNQIGGISAAIKAAKYGRKVALIESKLVGGTALNIGGIQKRLLYEAATIFNTNKDLEGFGFTKSSFLFNWKKLKENRTRYD